MENTEKSTLRNLMGVYLKNLVGLTSFCVAAQGMTSCVSVEQKSAAHTTRPAERIIGIIGKDARTGVVAFDTDGNFETVEATTRFDLTKPSERNVFNYLNPGTTLSIAQLRSLYTMARPQTNTQSDKIVSVVAKLPNTGVIAFDTDGNQQTVEATVTLDMTHPVEKRVFNALRKGDRMRISDYKALYKEIQNSYSR